MPNFSETFFAALAHPLRLRALLLLLQEGELCVCELTQALDASQPLISRHLAHLREARIVLDRREGLWIHYRLHPELPAWAGEVLSAAAAGLLSQPPHAGDMKALAAMSKRPQRCA